MYRAIFLFDVSELYHVLHQPAHELLQRQPELAQCYTLHDLKVGWFRHHLWRTHYVLMLPDPKHHATAGYMDHEFLEGCEFAIRRFYNMISRAVHPSFHPCFNEYCQVSVTDRDLRLTYTVDHPVPDTDIPSHLRRV